MRRLVALVLACTAAVASAGDIETGVVSSGLAFAVFGAYVPSTATLTPTATGVTGSGVASIARPTSGAVSVIAQSAITRAAVARIAAVAVTKGAFPLAVAGLTYAAYHRIKVAPNTEGGAGLARDPGQSPLPITEYCLYEAYFNGQALGVHTPSPRFCGPTTAAMAAVAVAWLNEVEYGDQAHTGTYDVNFYFVSSTTSTTFAIARTTSRCNGASCTVLGTYGDKSGGVSPSAGSQCPAYTDPFDPLLNIPAGSPVDGAGKCRTGRYSQPITSQEAADALMTSEHAATIDYPNMLREAAGLDPLGKVSIKDEEGVSTAVTIPSPAPKAVGTTSTTNRPDGTSTEVAESFELTPGAELGKVQWNKTTTTTEKDAAGNVVGTPTTTTTTPAPVATTAAPEPDPVNPCKSNPTSIGCSEMGDVTDAPLGTQSISVSAAPMPGWGAANATCPAPTVLTVSGMAIEINNSVLCDFLAGLRFIIVGMAGISAALIFLGGLKG